ncbi:MAG: T9SS type A sorting domain-containing protein [Ignavibacteriaceae bacterium]|nr:T9SS type A sorting domain-containing protein [Ignavibacteriaceae bacterium]
MKKLNFTLSIFLMTFTPSIYPQDQSIFIFDPNDVSSSFQSTLSQLTNDFVFIADTLDNAIFNYDAAFLFIDRPYILSEINAYRLINYTSDGHPLYAFSMLWFDSTSIAFWNHIGIADAGWLLISGVVDSVTGIDTTFTRDIFIDTSWYSGIPEVNGNVVPILSAWYQFPSSHFYSTFISGYDSLNVILDLFNLIYNYDFLQRVLIRFALIPPNDVEGDFNLLTDFKLFQNYPNPFNPSTKIKFQIPSFPLRQAQIDIWVTLKVYDVLGNEISTLVNEEKLPGTYEVEFSPESRIEHLPAGRQGPASGIYFYQLKAGNYIETKKMVLIK